MIYLKAQEEKSSKSPHEIAMEILKKEHEEAKRKELEDPYYKWRGMLNRRGDPLNEEELEERRQRSERAKSNPKNIQNNKNMRERWKSIKDEKSGKELELQNKFNKYSTEIESILKEDNLMSFMGLVNKLKNEGDDILLLMSTPDMFYRALRSGAYVISKYLYEICKPRPDKILSLAAAGESGNDKIINFLRLKYSLNDIKEFNALIRRNFTGASLMNFLEYIKKYSTLSQNIGRRGL